MRALLYKASTLATAVLVSATLSGPAQIEVPIEIHLPLLLKIATFDRSLATRVGDDFVVSVLYQRLYRTSLSAKDEFIRVLQSPHTDRIEGRPISAVATELHDSADLEQHFLSHGVDAVYVTPMRAIDLAGISDITRRLQIMSMTGVPVYTEMGIAVGVGIRGEKPEIVINLTAAKAEGIDFSSQLLKLARVIVEDGVGEAP